LRALAVTTATRSEALPDIPTVGDIVPGFESSGWFGIVAPRNTPSEIVDKLNREINAGARLADFGGTVLAGSPADFAIRASSISRPFSANSSTRIGTGCRSP
jgi:tripartite-type tricarboxylate transporter receptor subunit TctC